MNGNADISGFADGQEVCTSLLMKPEPKSIFTSQKDFGSQSSLRIIPPRIPITTSPNVPPSPTIFDHRIDGEAEFLSRKTSAVAGTEHSHDIASLGDWEGSRRWELDPARRTSISDVLLQGHSQTVPIEAPSIRKLTLPSPKSTVSAASITALASGQSKHPRSEENGAKLESAERPSKRPRPKLRPRHTLDPGSFTAANQKKLVASPLSPLFFSHSSRQRPVLPPTFSSSEAAATMLNQVREEHRGVTTLKLARGSISSSASPPRSVSTSGSLSRTGTPMSPDPRQKPSPGMQILGTVGVVELLELDERPTFIIDIANPINFTPGGQLQIVFANASLRAYETIFDMVMGAADLDSPGVAVTSDFPEFKSWALSFVKNGESMDICLPSFLYGGITWTCSTLRKRLRLISGSNVNMVTTSGSSTGALSNSSMLSDRFRGRRTGRPRSPLVESFEPTDYFGDAATPSVATPETISPPQIKPSPASDDHFAPPKPAVYASEDEVSTSSMILAQYPEIPSFDWTKLPISAALPRHIQFARSVDWASTALGPIEDWSFDLRTMCNMIMGSPHPAAMYWGPEYIVIYNEAYILLAGNKHPVLMGQSYKQAWGEIWHDIEGVFTSAMESGQATMKDDDCLFLRRNGYLEESYFSWSIIPLIGEDGSVVGLYNPVFEKTRRKIAERRMLTLREVGEKTAAAQEVKGFWGQVIKGLEYNEYDVPFVFLYSVSEDSDSDICSTNSGSLGQAPQCVLEGTLGVPKGHKAAVTPLNLKTSEDGFAPYLRESMKADRPILLTTDDGTLSSELIEGLEWRGFGDPCRAALVCPIYPTTGETILGFLVMGINPRRPYDDDYSLFIQLLSRQLATSMASVVLFEEEIKRGQRAARLAALDRQELSKQLDLRTQEAVESETKFTRMAEFAPVGMFIANSDGQITYSNDTWWEISRHPRSENSVNSWMDSIKDEDRAGVEAIWDSLVKNRTVVTHEFRFKTPWQSRNGTRGDTWVLLSAFPERSSSDGQLKSVFGCITNISQQKWAEGFQKRRMEEAMEMKRQQENFIDMTSHEMRNPLSAILQCSDQISTSLTKYKTAKENNLSAEKLLDVLDGSIDAAQTIALCAQHQKRIVDDILTLSKLDSALLIVTPVAVQPVAVVQRALKMFEGELDTNDIAMEFRMEKSYLDLDIDWVKLDPSRLLQVLINLTTNAIKFTHGQEKRTIVVSVGASEERPDGSDSDVSYFPSRSKHKDLTTDEDEWGVGQELYLQFAVQDTGRGLDDREKTLLFQRFSQTSPRTHVQYGGSGLGLFISRELTELQGGEIGVSSERGVGSTFAFYVKARRVDNISHDTPIATTINILRRNSSSTSVTLESRGNSSGKAVHQSSTHGQRRTSLVHMMAPKATAVSLLDHTKLKLLIVEDNLVNQRVLRKQLENLGFQTEVANHGGEALDFLKTTNFWSGKEQDGAELAVVLMDLEMPIMDGLTCARAIRDFEADGTITKHVPIIAVTANARLEQIETALAAGMDDVVSKPFRIPELIPKIDELVTKSNTTATTLASPMATVTETET